MSTTVRSAITFLMGSAVFIVLPLVAWGVTDIGGFLQDPARLGFVLLVLVLNAFAAIRIPEIGKARPAEKTTVRRQHAAVILLQVLSIANVMVGPFCDRREIAVIGQSEVLRIAGLCLYLLGFLTMHTAEARLGKHFTMEVSVLEGQSLVTDGPFRLIRHPRYLGIMTFSLGIALLFRSWPGLLCTAATMLVLFWRIRDEEAFMLREFGAAWEDYTRRSRRLIPYLF